MEKILDNEKVFALTCSCGCDNGIIARRSLNETDCIFISFVSGDFYQYQRGVLDNLKIKVKAALRTEHGYLAEIQVEDSELLAFRNYLAETKMIENIETSNCSKIELNIGSHSCFILLKTYMNPWEIIKGKYFQNFEIVLNKDERDALVKEIDKKYKMLKIIRKFSDEKVN